MSYQCFKIKRGTAFDSEVKKYFILSKKWDAVYHKVSNLLGENITKLAHSIDTLVIDLSELKNEENKKLFKKTGELKSNTKKAKRILEDYKRILDNCGLAGFNELRYINFAYGIIRTSYQQHLESFRSSENDIYYKADFNLEKKSNGMVEPITQIQYEEKYLEELKKREVSENG
jgi:hypothetical protein